MYHNNQCALFTRCQFCMVTSKLPPSRYSSFTSITLAPPPLLLLVLYFPSFFHKNPCVQLFMAQPECSAWGIFPFPLIHQSPKYSYTKTHKHTHHHHYHCPNPSILSPVSLPLCLRWAGMWWWHWCVLFLSPLFTNRRRPDWSMPTLRSLNRACSLKRPKLRNSKES